MLLAHSAVKNQSQVLCLLLLLVGCLLLSLEATCARKNLIMYVTCFDSQDARVL